MPVSKTCGNCQKEFFVPMRRHETVKYCSRECKTAAGWRELTCGQCGSLFKRKHSDNASSEQPFCSRACYSKAIPGRKLKVSPDAPRYYKVCEVCKVDFRVTMTRKDTARWCSRGCQSKDPVWRRQQSEQQQGEKSWRWTGGVYKLKSGYFRRKRNILGVPIVDFVHRLVILEAMLRECPKHPFIVMVNGKRRLNSEIDVHHIDRDRSNNDIANLLAVTPEAHARIHHRNKKPEPWECWPSNPKTW